MCSTPARSPCHAVILVLLLAGCTGCAGPVLTVRHVLPAAMPMPAGTKVVRVGTFTVAPAERQEAGGVLAEALRERLSACWTVVGNGPAPAKAARITGEVCIETDDARGTRPIREYDDRTRTWIRRDVPTLVRTVSVHVTFRVARAGSAKPALTVETDRTYRSTNDPRVRGDLGLDRPDDPARVPPAAEVIRDLLTACAAEFAAMVAPQVVAVEVATRGTLDGQGRAGLAAAEEGNFDGAVARLSAAVNAHPDDAALRFDLAAVLEAAGRLEESLAQYRAVVKGSGGKDAEAVAAADRLARVIARRKGG